MVSNTPLFDAIEQKKQLARVKGSIAEHVIDFCKSVGVGNEFTGNGLFLYCVGRATNVSPGSPTRILRVLQKDHVLKYTIVNRSQSLYRLDELNV